MDKTIAFLQNLFGLSHQQATSSDLTEEKRALLMHRVEGFWPKHKQFIGSITPKGTIVYCENGCQIGVVVEDLTFGEPPPWAHKIDTGGKLQVGDMWCPDCGGYWAGRFVEPLEGSGQHNGEKGHANDPTL